MIPVTFRPIEEWPDPIEAKRSPFDSPWSATLNLLDRELRALGAERVIVQVALRESQIRVDGWPKSKAIAKHPGVIVAFDSKHGPLKYATAAFDRWEENLRAVALGLEALRRVDRYGISKRGEQYTGWKALPAGDTSDLIARGRTLVGEHGGTTAALAATHPDRGGNPDDFRAVMAARGGRVVR